MGDGFNVSVEALRTHSETVRGVGEQLSEIGGAASTEGFGGLVYGVLFDLLAVPPLLIWSTKIQEAITSHWLVADAIADAIKDNADTYDGIEQANVTQVNKTGEGNG